MWLFIGCGLRDLVPLVGSLSVLVIVRVYAGGPSAVVFLGPPRPVVGDLYLNLLQGMLAVIRCRISCLPVCYPKI